MKCKKHLRAIKAQSQSKSFFFHFGLCLYGLMSATLRTSPAELRQQTIAYMVEWREKKEKKRYQSQPQYSQTLRDSVKCSSCFMERQPAPPAESVILTGCPVCPHVEINRLTRRVFGACEGQCWPSGAACDTNDETQGRKCPYKPKWLGLCSPLKTRSFPAPLSSKL